MKSAMLLSTAFVLGFCSTAHAANINVTTTAVAGDCFTPGGDPCDNFNGSDCTLQDALDVAECNGQGDTINIAAGTYDSDAANIFQYVASDNENFPLGLIGADGAIIDGLDNEEGMELNTRFAGGDDAANLTVSNIVFTRGNYSGPGGGLAVNITDADVTVDGCSFIANFSDEWGGGLYVSGFGESVQLFSNNLFLDNIANFDDGGGLFAESGQESITAVNNILAGNVSNEGSGGGIFLSAAIGDITVTNNTLFGNAATVDAGGGLALSVDDSGSTFQIYNNIVYAKTAGTNGDDIWTCEQGATVNLFNNDFLEYFSEGLDGDTCGGAPTLNQGSNISADPLFVDSGADDFHLTATSPARDTGDPAAPAMPSSDFDGNPRPAIPG
ncbi:MAG TPA: right-handed parallel beta-helix repeat-containing protein, partial [bacterium]|nr:right-handed parallel beta-helix repeat-containing protein [bacterium]